jgi:hypothetical protein
MYDVLVFLTCLFCSGGLVFFLVKFSKLMWLNVTDGADDRTIFYFSFIVIAFLGTLIVCFGALGLMPTSSFGRTILSYSYGMFLVQGLRARALGYPSMKMSKGLRIFLVLLSSIIFSVITVAAVLVFDPSETPWQKLGPFDQQGVFYLYSWILSPVLSIWNSGEELWKATLSFVSSIGLSIVMIVTMIVYDVREKRSTETLRNDLLSFIPIAGLFLMTLRIPLVWWLPWLIVILTFVSVFLHLWKEASSIGRRTKNYSSNIALVSLALSRLAKKPKLDDNDMFQISIIAKKCVNDVALNNYLRAKKIRRLQEKNLMDTLWRVKDTYLAEWRRREPRNIF